MLMPGVHHLLQLIEPLEPLDSLGKVYPIRLFSQVRRSGSTAEHRVSAVPKKELLQ
jgi:hypothetical protein